MLGLWAHGHKTPHDIRAFSKQVFIHLHWHRVVQHHGHRSSEAASLRGAVKMHAGRPKGGIADDLLGAATGGGTQTVAIRGTWPREPEVADQWRVKRDEL